MSHDHGIQHFGFNQLWNPEMMILTILLAVLYFLFVGRFRYRFVDSKPVSERQKILFLAGLGVFYIAMGSPLNFIGHHYLFSAHMLQMALMYLVMPPLLLLGTPEWVFRKLFLQRTLYKKMFLFLTHPLVSIVLFNMLFSLYHLPTIFDALMANHALHTLFHTVLTFGAFLMWWPLTNLLPEYQRMSSLWRIAYIFGSGLLLTPVCALVIFASQPMYSTYMNAPQLLAMLPTLDDQQLGGVIMKAVQEISFITAMAFIFFNWARKEKEKDSSMNSLSAEPELK
jgi:putative membrane protein